MATSKQSIFSDIEAKAKDLTNCEKYQQQTSRQIKQNTKYDHFSGCTTLDDFVENQTPGQRFGDTNMRKTIPANERLAVTLRFLASGDSFKSLSVDFRIAPNTISIFVPEVCDAIYKALKNEYLQVPNNEQMWIDIAQKFSDKWNFPHCIGAVDGKHIVMKAPPRSGSTFYNYKGTNSIVLMAIADADYRFIYIDVGCNGRVSDGGVFGKSTFQKALDNNTLRLPLPQPLLNRDRDCPYLLVADDAFRMQKHILKPYPGKNLTAGQRIFNYRLSRARRVVENAFDIMAKRFQILYRPIQLNEHKTTQITLASKIAVP
ncbi:protein ANTAGONIST OF LIKE HETEROCHROMATIN PROTEIN 1-like [Bactrocera tryoni]|uniref:protein ANTAGONIST OF LIKE HETEROCHROMATIN PROTEIN 1-like n=1 Tax=Bactrocera tryoni TaxID=59916 RepID=UPI001A98B922|nr:protein ANTAGONIST OF LIKE HETEROCHROMATIN PROTEIN 1-like [Bactrocera tryoni]